MSGLWLGIVLRCGSNFMVFRLKKGKPAVAVAPMEGVTDAPMRAFLTERGGFAYCVSEFLRISQNLPPKRIFLEHVPELARSGCVTNSGAPVQLQLLGGDPVLLAEAACLGIEAGAQGIDLNFGCPAPTVNRHDGGATLLKYPDRIFAIVRAVRQAVPARFPVSAKLRLGWDSREPILVNAVRAAEGGADWITIHARTKSQGYAPPVDWTFIGEVRRRLEIPVVANGDIWSFEDFLRCREITGAEHFMLGRSALANPYLALRVSAELGVPGAREQAERVGADTFDPRVIEHWVHLLERFAEIAGPQSKRSDYLVRRTKQWMKMASVGHRFDWFDRIKRFERFEEVLGCMGGAGSGFDSGKPSVPVAELSRSVG
jgi:tRNA-dihydrouridine synthase C